MFFLFLFVSSTGPGSKESIENAEPEQLPTLQSQFCEKDPVEKKKKKEKIPDPDTKWFFSQTQQVRKTD